MYEVPEDYIVPEQLPGVLESSTDLGPAVSVVGEPPRRGLRVGRLLIREFYISREEPSRQPSERSRIVLWRPIGRIARPRGWFRFPLEVDLKRATAFTRLRADYAASWSATARRDLRHAQERGIRIEAVPFDLFAQHMPSRGKFKRLFAYMSWQAKRFDEVYADRMRWYLAYTKEGAVAAGLGVLYLPEHRFSMSCTSFTSRAAKERSAPVALRDRWHRDALECGINYLDWNALWRPGDERSWKGFGAFKEKFAPTLVYLPPTYAAFVPSRTLLASLARLRRLFGSAAPASHEAR